MYGGHLRAIGSLGLMPFTTESIKLSPRSSISRPSEPAWASCSRRPVRISAAASLVPPRRSPGIPVSEQLVRVACCRGNNAMGECARVTSGPRPTSSVACLRAKHQSGVPDPVAPRVRPPARAGLQAIPRIRQRVGQPLHNSAVPSLSESAQGIWESVQTVGALTMPRGSLRVAQDEWLILQSISDAVECVSRKCVLFFISRVGVSADSQ